MKIIAFAGSNSSSSINHQLVSYAVKFVEHSELIKLNDYDAPMYSQDLENSEGIPQSIKHLGAKLSESNKLVISVCEHNGNISAFFKNILEWLSRNNREFLKNKQVVILSASPGSGGAQTALTITERTLPYFGAEVVSKLSVKGFYDNFKDGQIINQELNNKLVKAINSFR
jgi:NAD(P)H-dependent FMN reductase